ncbi:ClpXP protease specificity-enhancing factor [Bermanella marisrubri]|uniref:Stringent starvation protein B n=1 Tax=Bermanella marisrubri TaxID=207949 RepID=Q1MXT2_9GAMM|nr:ClpXP protease specificity-enhancing factor [Bermanella marisrubri]EAT10769.1 Stringent starvation protein B [Oceanobacter sp. RED65] [Bermanella marisrubri]QIZ83476.1 ClpXP protease specificity-enhancing factor [Bermanella marisrubri]
MTPSRPYLMRGLYEWVLDNESTPYVLVDANIVGVQVPMEYVNDGQIVLNVSPNAVRDLLISNDALSFNARFAGVTQNIYVPIVAVMAIYAKETGEGMVFGNEAGAPDPNDPPPAPQPPKEEKSEKPSGRPSLKVVK